jgi:histidine ammonia-lyase
VHGAALDTIAHAQLIAARELDAAIDNPMILPDGRVESCGNFHGAPLGFVCDFLAIAISELSAIAERRTDRMLDVSRSHGLPPFLTTDPGVNSGYMIGHYTQAAMAMENKRLAVPASVDSLPTSAMQEDHVSNGWAAARKLRRSVDNLRRILAVELVCAGAAIDLRAPLLPGPGTGAALAALRTAVAGPGPDRWLSPDLLAAEALLADGSLLRAVETAIGSLERNTSS